MLKLSAELKEFIRVQLRGEWGIGQTTFAAAGAVARNCELFWSLRFTVLTDAFSDLVVCVAHLESLFEQLVSLVPG